MSSLTPGAAKDLGRALRFIRQARGMSLRDVGKSAPMSPQYLQNIERGERMVVSPDVFVRLSRVYALPPRGLDDLVFKARLISALETRNVAPSDRDAIWRMVEHRMTELGYPIKTDLVELVASLLSGQRAE